MFSGVRAKGLFWLAGFVAIAVGPAACTLISGLEHYSAVDGADASVSSGHSGTPETSMSSSGRHPTEGPDATLGTDVSPVTGAGSDSGATVDMESAATDAATDADAETADDSSDGDAGPPADASDGGSPHDGGEAGAGDGGGCIQVKHSNGISGETFVDCAPLNTHNDTEAARACAAANVGACGQNTALCSALGGGSLECTTLSAICVCWAYSGPAAGHVSTSLAGPICACPLTMDPQWH